MVYGLQRSRKTDVTLNNNTNNNDATDTNDDTDDSSDESDADWEHSICTSEINLTDDSSDEHEIEDEHDLADMLPQLSKFVSTFS